MFMFIHFILHKIVEYKNIVFNKNKLNIWYL